MLWQQGLDDGHIPRPAIGNVVSHLVASAYRRAVAFAPLSKTLLALALVVFAVLYAALPRVVTADISHDDMNWVDRSLVPWWFPEPRVMDKSQWSADYWQQYNYAINHPSLARIFIRLTLHGIGVRERFEKKWDYSLTRDENVKRGAVLPWHVTLALRMVNLALFLGAVVLLYFGLARVLRNRLLAVLGILPIAFEPTMTTDFRCVVPYIGSDALFIFMTALFWVAWLALGKKGLVGAVVMGILSGLAVSTKVNASFMVGGLLLYYALTARGRRRVLYPAIAGALCAAVFLALNPVYFGGGWPWAKRVFTDTLALMEWIKNDKTSQAWAVYSRREIALGAFPHLLFAVPAGALAFRARKAPWLAPTVLWSVPIVLANLFFIYMPDPRYSAPIRVAFLVLLAAVTLDALRGALRSAYAGTVAGHDFAAQPVCGSVGKEGPG